MKDVELIIEVSSELEKILRFCEFVKDVHKMTNCKKNQVVQLEFLVKI